MRSLSGRRCVSHADPADEEDTERVKALVRDESRLQDMITIGVVAIADGENPRILEARLLGLLAGLVSHIFLDRQLSVGGFRPPLGSVCLAPEAEYDVQDERHQYRDGREPVRCGRQRVPPRPLRRRADRPAGFAVIGLPASQLPRSAANCRAVG